jgi:hypothetical protein
MTTKSIGKIKVTTKDGRTTIAPVVKLNASKRIAIQAKAARTQKAWKAKSK